MILGHKPLCLFDWEAWAELHDSLYSVIPGTLLVAWNLFVAFVAFLYLPVINQFGDCLLGCP